MRKLFFIILFSISGNVKSDTGSPSITAAPVPGMPVAPDTGTLSIIWEFVSTNPLIVSLIMALVPSIIGNIYFRAGYKKLQRLMHSMKYPPAIGSEELGHAIMLLGIGGVGKTSLLSALDPDNPEFDSERKTGDFYPFMIGKYGESHGKRYKYIYRGADISGQNLSTFSRGMITNQLEPNSYLKFGHVTALILVVDVIDPPEQKGGPRITGDSPNKKRVALHEKVWSKQMLQVISGFIAKDSLKVLILFVNAADCIESFARSGEINEESGPEHDKILYEFKGLIDNLNLFSDDVRMEIIIGSAKQGGAAIKKILSVLRETAVSEL